MAMRELPWFIGTCTRLGVVEGQKINLQHCVCFIVVLCVTWQICFKQTARAVVQGPAFNTAVIRADDKPLSAEHTPGIRLVPIKIETYDSVTELCLKF